MRETILSIFTTILGVILVLLIDRSRMPKIKIEIKDSANSDNTYASGRYNAGQRWKFFRVLVKNKKHFKSEINDLDAAYKKLQSLLS